MRRDAADAAGRTPVWEAARNGHQEIVNLLVDAGAHADTADIEGARGLVQRRAIARRWLKHASGCGGPRCVGG